MHKLHAIYANYPLYVCKTLCYFALHQVGTGHGEEPWIYQGKVLTGLTTRHATAV